jgi:hypothetical protein
VLVVEIFALFHGQCFPLLLYDILVTSSDQPCMFKKLDSMIWKKEGICKEISTFVYFIFVFQAIAQSHGA